MADKRVSAELAFPEDYVRALEEVKRLLDEADPMGLLAVVRRKDEYDSEAREAARRALPARQ